jgi:kanamycin nucleotidyltransferase
MLEYPVPTTREEKLEIVNIIKNRLLNRFNDSILAIGVYGSLGKGTDGPYSDIEMHVITDNHTQLEGYEFIYDKFKIEISIRTKDDIYHKAKKIDDMWPIKAGSYIHISPVYDPFHIFKDLKSLPLEITANDIKRVMREFMIWEPYETMGKIRNNWERKNLEYLSVGAKDLTWQTAKLIGLANKKYYSTRANTYKESLTMELKPDGYEELVKCVTDGNLTDKEEVYFFCENLWTGLNKWFDELGIEYRVNELPI